MRIDNVKSSDVSARQTGTRMNWCDRCDFKQMAANRMGLNAHGLSVVGQGHAPSAMKINDSVGHTPEKRPAATGDPGG